MIIQQKLPSLMKDNTNTFQCLEPYTYKKDKPVFSSGNYSVYAGVQTQTNVPVTIKIAKQFHLQLPKYLKKIKDTKSENVIKVYETTTENNTLIFVTEKVTYGSLKNALAKCERLDDADSLFLTKNLLNGHIDLLRSDCNWFGTEDDIEFTDTGIKLSWNNSMGYNLVNPFPRIIEKFAVRPEEKNSEQTLLPFPKSKIIQDLIKVSKQNASQISLSPAMKKKEKFAKKKGRSWFGLKETKNKNQYFDQVDYLAVSLEYGFIRVKMLEGGKLDQTILSLNKTRKTFTKLIQTYEDNNKTFIVSEYSNDGNLQGYVNKLKGASISLTEEHIQFFFYSLFDPLKNIQESPIKSINMLHIKNIYIENGIPKIGEPVPMNTKLEEMLIDRSEVPDFYHAEFKKNPQSKNQTYDTYSLGVLLYKLMYTEYPIFPNGKVHIPTTPSYNKRLKTTLELFLNEGGTLKSIESRIEVSENVLKQVKENKQKLNVKNKEVKQESKQILLEEEKNTNRSSESADDIPSEEQGDELGCCHVCCTKLDMSPNEEQQAKTQSVLGLQQSPYKVYRSCTKFFVVLLFYLFVFYFIFIQNQVLFLANQNLLHTYNATIATVNYSITTTDTNAFETQFNQTNRRVEDLVSLGCYIDGYAEGPVYSQFVYDGSSGWIGFLVGALLTLIIILLIKGWQVYSFDLVHAIYNYEHGKYNFNISNWIIFNLMWGSLIFGHFYFFNFIFSGYTQPCVGIKNPFDSTNSLFNDITRFQTVYLTTFALQLAVVIAQAIVMGCNSNVKYNKLLNPIVLFGPLLLIQWIILRMGVMDGYFTPNALNDTDSTILGYFTTGNAAVNYVNILGIIPELLLIGELILGFLIDWIYWGFIEKRRKMLIMQNSVASLNEAI